MRSNEVSEHEVKVFLAVRASGGQWLTNVELAARVRGVSPRTVRAKTAKLVAKGILEQVEVFPGYRYRLALNAPAMAAAYAARLSSVAEVLGMK